MVWRARKKKFIALLLLILVIPIDSTFIGARAEQFVLFEDGFESGDFSAWSGTSMSSGEAATVVDTLPLYGPYSAGFASDGGGGFETAYSYLDVSSSSKLYARGDFRVSQSGIADNNDRFYFLRFRAGDDDVAFAGWRQTGGVILWNLLIRDGTGYVTAYSDSAPSLNQWYSVELHWVEDEVDGYGELYVDGELVCSASGSNTADLGSVDQVRFGLAEVYNCGPTTVYGDSCEISQTFFSLKTSRTIASTGLISYPQVANVDLTIGVSGTGGATDPAPGNYAHPEGSEVLVSALPDSGWTLSHWLLDGVDVGDVDPYTVTMDDDHELTAFFVEEPQIDVDAYVYVDTSNIVDYNDLQLGTQLSYGSLGTFQSSADLRGMAQDANIKLIRFFDGLTASHMPTMMPCKNFDEASKTGTYDWTEVDDVIGKIFEMGAEPLIVIGCFPGGSLKIPSGMARNSVTNLPNPESYAAYTSEWVRHYREKGWPVRFYEIGNEAWVYFGSTPSTTKFGYFTDLFDASRTAMKQENPEVIVSFDYIHRKESTDRFLAQGIDVDTINFHKYDEWRLPTVKTEAQLLSNAENLQTWYSATEAEEEWFQQHGVHLPIINSECNMNGASPTTDERLQQMSGTVWIALVLRSEILSGVSYHIQFELTSSYYSGSYGFGMINTQDLEPWYPYYYYRMMGETLQAGAPILESSSSSSNVRTVAWRSGGKLNLLIIHKADVPKTIKVEGISGTMTFQKLDNTYSWMTPRVQTGSLSGSDIIELNGYTIMLIQAVD